MHEMFTNPEFWVLVAFLITIGILWNPVRRPLIAGLDGRITRQRNELNGAQRLRDEAQELLGSYQRKQRDALAEVEEILARARSEAEYLRTSSHKAMEADIERRQVQATDKIAQAEAQALAEVRNAAVEAAVAATRAIIIQQLDASRADILIDEAISELPARLH